MRAKRPSRHRRSMLVAAVAAVVMVPGAIPAVARDALGIFSGWGAFRDESPARCFAIAAPVRAGGASRLAPFASVATWPDDRVRAQLHIRLSRERDPRARVMLSVGERRFRLIAGASDAWAPDARTDAAIVAAIRSGRSMSVESVSKGGVAFADTYALGGAATAIDAAAVGCVGR